MVLIGININLYGFLKHVNTISVNRVFEKLKTNYI